MRLQQAVRHVCLAVAQREDWKHPDVRVTVAPKKGTLTVRVALSGDHRREDVERILRHSIDTLRDRQTEEVRSAWPVVEIRPLAINIVGVTYVGTTIIGGQG